MKKVFLLALLVAFAGSVMAQRNCATTEIEQLNKTPEQLIKQREYFENWLQQKRASLVGTNALQEQSATIIYKIPVVVHIIHNGEVYGEGFNITDEQIASQIVVLNEDFRHLNADSINTPTIFQPVMADIGFEFELAKRDPNGLPTMGITRTKGTQSSWTRYELDEIKSLSYWSSDDYFNIWVAPTSADFLGWAQFPTSDTLTDVNGHTTGNPVTDGVVIATKAFGSAELYPQGEYLPQFNLGRTATHEAGHFFGLYHIWGQSISDPSCSEDDYIGDTPQTSQNYFNCQPEGTATYSCNPSEPSMFMNYMDYVDDGCMNLFSLGQKGRMVIIVNSSPRRASLLASNALDPPLPLDAAIAAIPSPLIGVCSSNIIPSVNIINAGEEQIAQIEINITINNINLGQQLFPLTLNAGKDTTLVFNNYTLNQYGNQTITATIKKVNGRIDDSTVNDTHTKDVYYSEQVTTLNEEFTSWPDTWAVRSEAPISNWNYQQAPNLVVDNKAAVLNYYQQNSAFEDQLITPILDMSSYTAPYFLFDHAYGERDGYIDNLAVLVSTDCGNTFQDTLYLKTGNELTTTKIPAKFTPSGSVDWHTNKIDLGNYTSQPIQLAFIGKSGGGNNIYLDNFRLVDNNYEDLNLIGLQNESGAFAASVNTIGVIIENSGATIINSIEIEATEANVTLGTQFFDNISLDPGQRMTLNFNNKFGAGQQNIKFKLLLNDANSGNNEFEATSNFITSRELIPFRENFNDGPWNSSNNWTITTPYDDTKWEMSSQTNNYLGYQAITKGNIGLHDWLVMPMFDLSQNNLASIQFDLAYAGNEENNELLRVWVSTNGGQSFDHLLETITADQMATATSIEEWLPTTEDDWRTIFFDLSDFAGEENVLIAFESIDGDGNNIYLDNIELFISNEQNDIEIEVNMMAIYPNPVSDLNAQITFNLNIKQDIKVRILDVQGNIISDQSFTDVLNQTFPIELSTNMNGIYIIQAIGADFSDVSRILVSR